MGTIPRKEGYETAELCLKINSRLGEGTIWNHLTNELYWIDILGRKLNIFNPQTNSNRSIQMPSIIGTVVPVGNENAIVGLHDGVYIIEMNLGQITPHSSLDLTNPKLRLNDGKCDVMGRLWVGSMHMKEVEGMGKLYRVDHLGNYKIMLESVTISNGIVWSLDNTVLYYIDTPTLKIQAFDFDTSTGEIDNKRVIIEIPHELGFPDGMTIDSEGQLWVALWRGGAIARFNPKNGKLTQKINVPALNVTSCAFGGENMDILFISTANVDMTAADHRKYPDAGSIFMAKPGAKGVESNFFKLQEP